MKTIITILTTFISLCAFGQKTIHADSMKMANLLLDQEVEKFLNQAEADNHDFMIIRAYDSTFYSRCHFMIEKDSCSYAHILDVNPDYSIGYSHCSQIRRRNTNPCDDYIERIRFDLTIYEDFKPDKPSYSTFTNAQYTLIGKIDGKYLHEEFGKDFISTFHSGALY